MNQDSEAQFFGINALLGEREFHLLQNKHIAIIGLGGVGSWAVESLARTGIGELTLIDLDEVCVTNINRQLPALHSTVGKAKAQVLKERILDINPSARVNIILDFVTPSNMQELISKEFDLVIDAIDSLKSKVELLSFCHSQGIKIITSGSAGGRRDISQIKKEDLGRTINDKFLMRVRKKLKREYGFPKLKNKKFHIPCIYSTEIVETASAGSGKACDIYLGSLSYITGTFGFYLASEAINILIKDYETN